MGIAVSTCRSFPSPAALGVNLHVDRTFLACIDESTRATLRAAMLIFTARRCCRAQFPWSVFIERSLLRHAHMR
jgi:hypothetical protein